MNEFSIAVAMGNRAEASQKASLESAFHPCFCNKTLLQDGASAGDFYELDFCETVVWCGLVLGLKHRTSMD
jgi:hypothetical protein